MATTTTPGDSAHAELTSPVNAATTTSATSKASPYMVPTSSTTSSASTLASQPAIDSGPIPSNAIGKPVVNSHAKDALELNEAELTPLTKKFTKAEWKGVRDLGALLPGIFADAYDKDTEASNKIVRMWGVDIDPQHPAKDARVSVILVKFLRAQKMNLSAAQDMLVKTLRWRQSFDRDSLMKEEFDPKVFGPLAHVYRKDREGRPVRYSECKGYCNLKIDSKDIIRHVRRGVQTMERTMEALDFISVDQVVKVIDCEGISLLPKENSQTKISSQFASIIKSHYPGYIARSVLVNVSLISRCYVKVKYFPVNVKTIIAGHDVSAIRKVILPFVDEEDIPKKYGGSAEGW